MSDPAEDPQFLSFEAQFELAPPGTPATPRSPGREREPEDGPFREAYLVSFEAELEPVPPGTPAAPRPPGREREPARAGEVTVTLRATDGASAAEVLRKVQDVLRSHGLTVEVVPADPDR